MGKTYRHKSKRQKDVYQRRQQNRQDKQDRIRFESNQGKENQK